MRTKDEALHARRRQQIVAAAARTFAASGVRQTTMGQICAEAKLSAGALYRYFASKEEIIAALAESENQQNQELIEYLESQQDVLSGLRAALPDIVKALSQYQNARLLLEMSAEASRNPDIAAPMLATEAAFSKALTTLFRNGQKAGTVSGEVDVDAFVFVLIAMLDGLGGQYVFPVKLSRKRVAAMLERMIEGALTPP